MRIGMSRLCSATLIIQQYVEVGVPVPRFDLNTLLSWLRAIAEAAISLGLPLRTPRTAGSLTPRPPVATPRGALMAV
jgi:hypothetical protein